MTQPDRIARDVTVRGLVQGVFFRDSSRQVAEELGVAGWVSNEPDGTVRAHLEGPAPAVEQMVRWMHGGPRHAVVEAVEVHDAPVTGASSFTAR
jgi:acylphosphatase